MGLTEKTQDISVWDIVCLVGLCENFFALRGNYTMTSIVYRLSAMANYSRCSIGLGYVSQLLNERIRHRSKPPYQNILDNWKP